MPKTDKDGQTVRFRLVCEQSPVDQTSDSASEFGLQDKQQQLLPGVLQPDGTLVYLFTLEASPGKEQNTLRWRGSYVQGGSAEPFLYLSVKRTGGEPPQWIKRIKIPLSGITTTQVDSASNLDGAVLEGRISGRGSGTVALLGDGWDVREMQTS